MPISAFVAQGTAGVAGATVTFTMVTPTGNVTKRATTDSTGAAVWNFKMNPKAAKGTYSVTAQAILGSQTVTSAPVTFAVQ